LNYGSGGLLGKKVVGTINTKMRSVKFVAQIGCIVIKKKDVRQGQGQAELLVI
jgi:hypothetical protein